MVNGLNLELDQRRLTIELGWKAGHWVGCPERWQECLIADHAPERTWRHLDTMQFETRIRARVPRSQCREHGVKAVAVPWAEPGSRFALFFKRFAIAVLLPSKSLRQACELPALDWDAALRIMERTVRRGWDRCELEALKYAGIDEKSFEAGQS